MKFAYDAAHTLTYGYWTCAECEAEFYGGGVALHNTGCSQAKSYESCTYTFGPKEVQEAKDAALRNGRDDQPTPLGPLSLRVLKDQFPFLVAG